MAERHRASNPSKGTKEGGSKEGGKSNKGAVEGTIGTIGGCPVLIQTGPNIKVLAQVRIIHSTHLAISINAFSLHHTALLSHTLSHSQSLTLSNTLLHFLTVFHSLSLSLTLSHSLSLSLTLSHPSSGAQSRGVGELVLPC